jgi:hypothetical protein
VARGNRAGASRARNYVARVLSRNHVFGDISPKRLRLTRSADAALAYGLVFTFIDVTSFFLRLGLALAAAWIGTKGDCGLRKSGGRLLGVAVMVGSCGKSAVGSGQWKVNSAIAGPSTGRAGGSHTHKKTGRGSGPLPAFLSWGGCSNGPFESPGDRGDEPHGSPDGASTVPIVLVLQYSRFRRVLARTEILAPFCTLQ